MCLITVCWGMDGRKIQNNVDLLAVSSCHASLMSKSGVGASVLENSLYVVPLVFAAPMQSITSWPNMAAGVPSTQSGGRMK